MAAAASLLNLFVTAPRSSSSGRLEAPDEPRPRSRHRQGHGPDPAPLLRAQGHDQVPRGAGSTSPHKFRGRLQLLYDEWGTLKCETCFQCAQACPIECIDMGGIDTRGRFHVHWGAPETYGERREESALRRSGRPVPDPAYRPFAPIDLRRRRRDPRGLRPRPGARCSPILEATQAAYGYLPVAALKRISQRTGAWYAMIYGTATLLRPPALRAGRRDRAGRRGRRPPAARGDLPRRPRRGARRRAGQAAPAHRAAQA